MSVGGYLFHHKNTDFGGKTLHGGPRIGGSARLQVEILTGKGAALRVSWVGVMGCADGVCDRRLWPGVCTPGDIMSPLFRGWEFGPGSHNCPPAPFASAGQVCSVEPPGCGRRIVRVGLRVAIFARSQGRGARMSPASIRANAAVGFACLMLAAIMPAATYGHGGGGHAGGGGGHGGGSWGSWNSGYPSSASLYVRGGRSGFGSGNAFGYGAGLGGSSSPAWIGFPEDLPAARIHRFLSAHRPHLPWGTHHGAS